MNKNELYLATFHKFKNLIIPDLPDIIFTSYILKEKELENILNSRINLEELITYIITKKVKTRTQLIKTFEEFLKEAQIEFK